MELEVGALLGTWAGPLLIAGGVTFYFMRNIVKTQAEELVSLREYVHQRDQRITALELRVSAMAEENTRRKNENVIMQRILADRDPAAVASRSVTRENHKILSALSSAIADMASDMATLTETAKRFESSYCDKANHEHNQTVSG